MKKKKILLYECGCLAVKNGLRLQTYCKVHLLPLSRAAVFDLYPKKVRTALRKVGKNPRSVLVKELDDLWSELVKLRANYRSEISGVSRGQAVLNSHHLLGKTNKSYGIRWEPLNGVCCTKGEHFFGFHETAQRLSFERKIQALRGMDIFEKLEYIAATRKRPDLELTKLFLKAEIAKEKSHGQKNLL